MALHRREGSVAAASVAKGFHHLCKKLRAYCVSKIYNVDETGILCNLFSRKTFVKQGEHTKFICNLK